MADVTSPRVGTEWAVESGYTASFVAPSTYLLKPDIRAKIFDAYQENMLYDTLIHSGRTKVTDNTTYRHFEHDSYFHVHTVKSVSGSTGNTAVVTLEDDPEDHLQSGALSQIKKKDAVLIFTAADGVKHAYVTAYNKATPDAHTVTLDPFENYDLANLAAGDRIGIYSSGASDGANMTESTSRLPVDFYNYVQIIDTKKDIDEGEAANKSWVEVNGKPYYYSQQVVDGDFEQRIKIDNAFIFGYRGTKTDPVTSKTAYFTGGLEYWADSEGYEEPYSTDFGLTDLQNVCRNLSLERAPSKQWFLVGNELDMSIDKFAKGYLDNTAINWAEMGMGSVANRMLDFGIDGFRYNGFSFMKQKLQIFNYIGLTGGFSASPYPDMGFVVSWDKFRDAKGEDMDTVCLRYKQNDRGSRLNKFWTRDYKITSDDQADFNWKSEVGIQIALARHINKVTKA